MIKAFISHSSKQKEYATDLVERLGRDFCIIDCYNFESAYKTIDEVYAKLDDCSVFVLLLTREALKSAWVDKEVKKAYEYFNKNQLEQFLPFIIDDSLKLNEVPKWLRKEECFNLKYFKSPVMLARDIEQKFRRLIWQKNDQIRKMETIIVGRNADLSKFEEKFLSARREKIRSLIVAGRAGVGKETFARQCMEKIGYPLETQPFHINLEPKENIENFILQLNLITRKYSTDELHQVLAQAPQNKAHTAVLLLNELYDSKSIVFVEDSMACILPNRELADWLVDIVNDKDLNPQMGLYVLSTILPQTYMESHYPSVISIPLQPLERLDRKKLFYNYMSIYQVQNVSDEDVNFFVDRLLQSPMQLRLAVEAIKTCSLPNAKRDIENLLQAGDKKMRPLLERFSTQDQRDLLIVLSKMDFISYSILESVFQEQITEVLKTLEELMNFGLVENFGPSQEYFRLDHFFSDYIKRCRFKLPSDLEMLLNDVLENKIIDDNNLITEDVSIYMYDIKNRIVKGQFTSADLLIPSIAIKSVIDLYNQNKYDLVINICDKVLEENAKFYKEVSRELLYWLCLSLCRVQDEARFYEEVKQIDGADYWFLKGFYKRIEKKYGEAEELFNNALEKAPQMKRAKRELVTALLAQKKYTNALDLAQENYQQDSENSYHIHAYFRCLVKKRKIDGEDKQMLDELLNAMQNTYSRKKEELLCAMKIEYDAYVLHQLPSDILQKIQDAEKLYPESLNIQRVVSDYKYRQAMISKEEFFDEDCDL